MRWLVVHLLWKIQHSFSYDNFVVSWLVCRAFLKDMENQPEKCNSDCVKYHFIEKKPQVYFAQVNFAIQHNWEISYYWWVQILAVWWFAVFIAGTNLKISVRCLVTG